MKTARVAVCPPRNPTSSLELATSHTSAGSSASCSSRSNVTRGIAQGQCLFLVVGHIYEGDAQLLVHLL